MHADGALGPVILGGVLAGRQAHRQRVVDNTVKVWDSQTGKEVSVLFDIGVSFAAACTVLTSVVGP